MSQTPAISVVMAVHNRERFLAEAIDSILAQTFDDFEFIIVDDGSTDGSAGIIRAYAARDRRIRRLQFERNRGVAASSNLGIRHARGQFIARMDSDDISLPQRFETQLAHLRAHPEIGVLGCGLVMADECLARRENWDYPAQHALIAYKVLFSGSGLGHATTVMRRKALLEAQGYREGVFHAVDIDLWTRLLGIARFANLPQRLYIYRRHGQSTTISQPASHKQAASEHKRKALQRVWTDAPEDTAMRLHWLSTKATFGWLDGYRVKRELRALCEKMIAANWIDAADATLLQRELHGRITHDSPWVWRKIRQWLRYRIGF